jgi:hypothetical protein
MADLWLPQHLKPAHKPVKVVFYFNKQINRIMVGFPEEFPAPHGFEKIVCQSANEVDIWSQKMRDQDRRDQEMSDEEREKVEGSIRQMARQELLHKMATARNQMNRDFCRWALEQMDLEDERRKATKRESYMHAEAYEDGK